MVDSIVVDRDNENQINKFDGATNTRILPVSATPPSKPSTPWYKKEETIVEKRVGRTAKFLHWIGYEEIFSSQVWRASVAELLSTAILVFMLDTIFISSKISHETPNIVFACFVALIVAFLRLATHPISGGHSNPTITISAAFMGLISLSRAMIYLIAQCIGSILGAWALQAMVKGSITSSYLLGGCTLAVATPGPEGLTTIGIETAQGLWAEIIYTFIFLFSVWMTFDQQRSKALGQLVMCSITGIVVGLTMYLSTTVTTKKGYTGAIINPARCIGPAVVRGGHLWNDHWVFWVGPILASVAFYLYSMVLPLEHFKARIAKE
ncbi:aquaporin-like [Chenopodium quinoa]|uniref:aquaporin-like n=1 Tax=Chenopodium quinoa TaxID=63459 RepID=UPI000B7881B1|nr:aquaporin-like [Chenopodium quinoa]